MITRARKHTTVRQARPPLGDKTNFTESPNLHSRKKHKTKATKSTKQPSKTSSTSSKINLPVQLKTKDSEVDSNKKVNLQCVDTINLKMPNVQTTKCVDNQGITQINVKNKKKVVKKIATQKSHNRKITNTPEKDKENDNLNDKVLKNVTVKLTNCERIEKLLKSDNKPQEPVKHVQFDNKKINILTTPKFEKVLRRRRAKNYVDSSPSENSNITLEESKNNEPFKKIPVYLQTNVNEQKQKPDDPFEFIAESPKKKRRKGKNGKNEEESSDSDSNIYDKSMHEVLKSVREKEKRKKLVKKQTHKKSQVKNIQKEVAVLKSNNKTEHVIESTSKNVNVVRSKLTNKDVIDRLSKQIRFLRRKIVLTSDGNFDVSSKENENSSEKYFGFDVDSNEDNAITMLPPIQKINVMKPLDNIRPISKTISKKFTSLTSTPIPVTRKPNKNLLRQFEKPNLPKKVNIISNVLLSTSKNTPKTSSSVDSASQLIESSLNNEAPKVRSIAKLSSSLFSSPNPQTPIDSFHGFDNSICKPYSIIVQSNQTRLKDFQNVSNIKRRISMKRMSSPWRSDHVAVRRNPHILFLKDTSLLPSYNQDMVLDPDLIEKPIGQHINDTQNVTNAIQTSILDFLDTSKVSTHSTPVKRNPNRTLFDEGDFSPIKQKSAVRDNEKENVQTETSPNVIEESNTSDVLNEKSKGSPLKPRNRIDVVPKKLTVKFSIRNYFGFDSPDNNKENRKVARTKVRTKVKKNENALPMRVPAKVIKEIQEEVAEKLVDNVELEENIEEDVQENPVNNSLHDSETKNENAPRIGLFEDPEEVKAPERVYARKRTKRVRLVSVDSEGDEEEKPKRKRKDVRTPAEEEEFNKWAAQFNAMCEEVDKYNLEIV